jgi:hypothetical protein
VIDQRSAVRTPASVCSDDDGSCFPQSTMSSTIPAGAGLHTFTIDGYYSTSNGAYTFRYTRP